MSAKTYQKAYVIGDKETGILIVTLNPLRAALVERDKIQEYADRHKLTFATVFGQVAAAIKGLILETDPPGGPAKGAMVLTAFAELIVRGATVTDAEFCFISDVETSKWKSKRSGFLPIEPIITDLDAFRQGDVLKSELMGPGDKPKTGKASTKSK
ncbi:hypothetical protein [Mesorhizobium sp. M0019]|uniref:hypothetical protein n=1 Tax=Mesorhizobium sp. M0019 TaxID=2956845 RepID=UPI00333BADF3